MTVQDFIKSQNRTFTDIIQNDASIYNQVFLDEKQKNWLVPIVDKLDKLSIQEDREIIKNVISKLQSEILFDDNDTTILTVFIARINTIVKVANRINNFKNDALLDNNMKLSIVNLFNVAKQSDTFMDFDFPLNQNLNSFKVHLFSIIKHCQKPDLYPIFYPFWQKMTKNVLEKNSDYDSLCQFYREFPIEDRTLAFGSYYISIFKLMQIDLEKIEDREDKRLIIEFLKREVINLAEYQKELALLMENNKINSNKKYWLYSPGERAYKWESFYNDGIMALGWDDLGDLSQYNSRDQIQQQLISNSSSESNQSNNTSANDEFANAMSIGDVVIVKRGRRELLGFGIVTSDYFYHSEREEYKHCRNVKWQLKGSWPVDHQLVLKTLTDITSYSGILIPNEKYYQSLLNIMLGQKVNTRYNQHISLLEYKKQIILQGPPGTGKTREAKLIAKEMLALEDVKALNNNEQFRLIQFHPSYTYEDFVRGIVAKPNPEGDGIVYDAENKTLGEFAAIALKNYLDSKKDSQQLTREVLLKLQFDQFVEHVNDLIEKDNGFFSLTDNVGLVSTEDEDAFRFRSKNSDWSKHGLRIWFKDLLRSHLDGNTSRQQVKHNPNVSPLVRHHSSYFVRVLNLFQDFIKNSSTKTEKAEAIKEKKYILVIDEINRANLSSVLGELIYALEYRGEAVESMYDVDGKELILPPNLYIIGTMNTADRSVGHIDYAIRRRFAFVDVLPKDLSNEDHIQFDSALFNSVKALFTLDGYETRSQYLSNELDPKDVALGHSYFIDKSKEGGNMQIRLEYEIKPILREYVKDGVLIGEKILEEIENLEASI